ncbi:MAG TPA: bifunctional phosphoribosylaminoimidazolecarboxamide formyltransferase/IMP cyclohydrolase, partial [Nitrospira sp.]|nr:bifunctional phosphoribosylaminoimidazolecarboxamide formyltransferase/IMP cyclohydrolase [Nitrospira sp.]
MASIKRALISVSDKTGVVDLAKGLEALGAEILSTGGTAKALRDAGVKVTDVAAYTGSPEILDGRVKTLHPKIHGGLLGRRSVPAHVDQMKQHNIGPIDIVVVNLYPFEATISKPNCHFDDAIENIDIGGPSMLRSAAKNHEDVLVVVDPADYQRVLNAAKDNTVTRALRRELAMKVFQHTARYDSVIAAYLEKQLQGGDVKFPKVLSLQYELGEALRYGENPHQQGAFYRELHSNEPSVSRGKILHGKAMS